MFRLGQAVSDLGDEEILDEEEYYADKEAEETVRKCLSLK